MRGGVVLWSLMASAPVLLLGVMGIVGRTQVSTWEFESYTPKENLALTAYQEPVRSAHVLSSVDPMSPNFATLTTKTADLWLKGYDSGLLTDVLPGSLEDQGTSGSKGQIGEARQLLINNLHIAAVAAKDSGSELGYCLAHAQIIRVADIGKYAGSASVQQSALIQIGSLQRIADRWTILSKEEQRRVSEELKEVRRSDVPLKALAERLSHLAIRRQMTQHDSMKNMGKVFHASNLESLIPPEGMKLKGLEGRSKEAGLDLALGVSIAASLKAEEKFRSIFKTVVPAV